jgi:polar amino acid transport system permease protein
MVYVLAMPELFYTIQMIYNRTQEVIPLLMVGPSGIWRSPASCR